MLGKNLGTIMDEKIQRIDHHKNDIRKHAKNLLMTELEKVGFHHFMMTENESKILDVSVETLTGITIQLLAKNVKN